MKPINPGGHKWPCLRRAAFFDSFVAFIFFFDIFYLNLSIF